MSEDGDNSVSITAEFLRVQLLLLINEIDCLFVTHRDILLPYMHVITCHSQGFVPLF